MPSAPYGSGKLVRKGRLELPRVTPLAPKASASTNSATFAPDKNPDRRFILNSEPWSCLAGGPCRDRTYDPLIKSQLLYQLS